MKGPAILLGFTSDSFGINTRPIDSLCRLLAKPLTPDSAGSLITQGDHRFAPAEFAACQSIEEAIERDPFDADTLEISEKSAGPVTDEPKHGSWSPYTWDPKAASNKWRAATEAVPAPIVNDKPSYSLADIRSLYGENPQTPLESDGLVTIEPTRGFSWSPFRWDPKAVSDFAEQLAWTESSANDRRPAMETIPLDSVAHSPVVVPESVDPLLPAEKQTLPAEAMLDQSKITTQAAVVVPEPVAVKSKFSTSMEQPPSYVDPNQTYRK